MDVGVLEKQDTSNCRHMAVAEGRRCNSSAEAWEDAPAGTVHQVRVVGTEGGAESGESEESLSSLDCCMAKAADCTRDIWVRPRDSAGTVSESKMRRDVVVKAAEAHAAYTQAHNPASGLAHNCSWNVLFRTLGLDMRSAAEVHEEQALGLCESPTQAEAMMFETRIQRMLHGMNADGVEGSQSLAGEQGEGRWEGRWEGCMSFVRPDAPDVLAVPRALEKYDQRCSTAY